MAGLRYPISADATAFESAMKRVGDLVVSQSAAMAARFDAVTGSATKIGAAMVDARVKAAAMGAEIGARFTSAQGTLESLSRVIGAVPAGLAAVGAAIAVWHLVSAAVDAARERLEAVLKVAQGAETAGVGASFFQRWTAEATKLNLEVSKLEGMLSKARSATEIRIGEGDKTSSSAGGDRLRQNVLAGNLSQRDLDAYNAAGNQEARIRVVLDLLDQLRARNADVAAFDLAGKFFGPDFEAKMRSGVDIIGQLRSAIDSVTQTGGDGRRILSPQEIEAAERLKRTIEETQRILAEAMAPIQRDLAEYQARQAQSAAEFNRSLADAAASVLSLYNVFVQLGAVLEKLGNLSIWKRISDAAAAWGMVSYKGMELVNPDSGKPVLGGSGSVGAGASGVARLPIMGGKVDTSKSLPSLGGSKGGGSGSDGDTVDQIQRLIQQMEKANDLARAELATVGLSNVERAKAVALARADAAVREAGRALTEEERNQIIAKAEATQRLNDKLADQRQKLAENAEAMRTFGQLGADALSGMILEARTFDDVLQGLLKQLARMALQAAFTGQGPLGGLFGTSALPSSGPNAVGGLVGLLQTGFKAIPGFAEGTNYAPGGLALVGERGPELVNLPRGAQVIPNYAMPSAVAPRGGAPVIHIGGSTIDARGADAGVEARLRASLDARDRAMVQRLGPLIRDLSRRGGL